MPPDDRAARPESTAHSVLRRARGPAALALLAAGGLALSGTAELGPGPRASLDVAVRVLFVVAAGWLLTALADLGLQRRIRSLDLARADNLEERKQATRLDVLRRVLLVAGGFATLAAALTVVPWARQIGVSLFASAGIAGIALGLAARPVLANLIAGLQIAFTQPIRIDDAVVVEGEWGWVEEIGLFYVVVRLWDWRRLVVPLAHFIEKPFQNWTRESASIIGTVTWSVDYRAPVAAMRAELHAICERSPLWDRNVVNLQVTDAGDRTLQIRALASARTSPEAWDLRCFIREEMIGWLQREHPEALPRLRTEPGAARPAHGGAEPAQAFERDESLQATGEAAG